jgi:hypothetical protein
MKTPRVRHVIDGLRDRGDLVVEDRKDAWLVRIPKGSEFVCEITVPRDWCFEWFACVKRVDEKKPDWSDWMEHYGSPDEVLDAEMADCITSFVARVTQSELKLPLNIYEDNA